MATNKYKGIAIFGAPGSGKTTIAKFLLDYFPGAEYLEAFESVISPALSVKEKLPEKEMDFIRTIGKIHEKRIKKTASRNDARNFFTYLKNRYSPPVIAKTLIHIHQKDFPKKFVIISGIRGYGNSV